jgi:hypothetical protein
LNINGVERRGEMRKISGKREGMRGVQYVQGRQLEACTKNQQQQVVKCTKIKRRITHT